MQLSKMTKNYEKLLLTILFIILFALTRLPQLERDNVNPDSVNWHTRSEQFANGLKYLQLDKTYQHYQPGVTLMWIMSPIVEVTKEFYTDNAPYNEKTFQTYDYVSKLAVISVQLALTILAIYLFGSFVGFKKSLAVISLFTFEPFFIGNSRLVHLDVLLSLLLFNGLLLSYKAINKSTFVNILVSGFFFALAFLTKSIGVGGFLYAAGAGGLIIFLKNFKVTKDIKSSIIPALRFALILILTSLAFIFLMWPALWVNFAWVMDKLYYGAFRVGLAKGHNQIFLDGETRDAGWLFYPVVLLYKLSILTTLGLILNIFINKVAKIKDLFRTFTLEHYLFFFYLGYFVVMSVSTKKIDRYMVIMYPMFSILAVYGYLKVYGFLKSSINKATLVFSGFIITLASYALVLPLFSFYPYYFTFTNPLLGSPKFVHENIIAQKPFGIGVYDVRDYIVNKYGKDVRVALIDPKPFSYLFDPENVLYIDTVGTRAFDILILGVNEEMPSKIARGKYEFNKDPSIYINGLEYWKIYVRGAEKQQTN